MSFLNHSQPMTNRAFKLLNAHTVRKMLTRATHALVFLISKFKCIGLRYMGDAAAGSILNPLKFIRDDRYHLPASTIDRG